MAPCSWGSLGQRTYHFSVISSGPATVFITKKIFKKRTIAEIEVVINAEIFHQNYCHMGEILGVEG